MRSRENGRPHRKTGADGRHNRKSPGCPYRVVYLVENPFVLRALENVIATTKKAARTLAPDCEVFWHVLDKNGVTCAEGAFVGGRAYEGSENNEVLKRKHREGWEPAT